MVTQQVLRQRTLMQSVQARAQAQKQLQQIQPVQQLKKVEVSQEVPDFAEGRTESYFKALRFIEAKSRGERSAELYGDKFASQIYKRLLKENPEMRKAVDRGAEVLASVIRGGFGSPEEFMAVSKTLQKIPARTAPWSTTSDKPISSKEQFLQDIGKQQDIIRGETQRYEGLGYSLSQARTLANEGYRQRQSFSPTQAQQVLTGGRDTGFVTAAPPPAPTSAVGFIAQQFGVKGVVPGPAPIVPIITRQAERFLETPISQVRDIGRGFVSGAQMGVVTIRRGAEEALAGVKKGVEFVYTEPIIGEFLEMPLTPSIQRVAPPSIVETILPFKTPPLTLQTPFLLAGKGKKAIAKFTREQLEDMYSRIPEQYRFEAPIVRAKDKPQFNKLMRDFRAGKITAKQLQDNLKKLRGKMTPEELGKGIETFIETVPYFIPGVGVGLLAADVVTAREEFKGAKEQSLIEAEKSYKEYIKEEPEIGFELLSEKQYIEEVAPQIEEQIREQAVITGGIAGTFLAGGAILKSGKATTKFFKTPIVTKVPTRALKDPIRTTILSRKGPKITSQFIIKGEVMPPIKVIETTRFRKLLKLKPKKEYILPAKPFSIKTPFSIIGDQPFLVSEAVAGRKFGTYSLIEGSSAPTSLESLRGLTKTRQFEWQRLAEEITGIPVALKNVPKILSKNAKKIESFIEAKKLVRMTPGKRTIKITEPWKPGKRITRAEAVSEIKFVKETDKFKVFEGITISKDVTFPGARTTGKTQKLREVILEIKQPSYLGKPGDVKIIKPSTIDKTPLSKTFQIQEVKLLPVPPLPKVEKLPPVKTVLILDKAKPSMVGGAGLATIPWMGTGMFERTKRIIVKDLPISTKAPFIEEVAVIPVVIPKITPILDLRPVTKVEVKTKIIVTPIVSVTPKPIIKESVKVKLAQVSIPKLLIRQKVAQILVTKPVVTPRVMQRQISRPTKFGEPIIKIPTFKFKPKRKPKRRPRVMKPKVGYGIEIKRRGKWERVKIPYAFATEEGAEAIAMRKVMGEAAASFRIVKSKKIIKRTGLKPTAFQKVLFRPGKEKGVKVQKKLFRIITPGEVKEISWAGGIAVKGKKRKKKVKKKTKKKAKGGKKKR